MDDVQSYDPWPDHCIGWQQKFVWFPKKCYYTDKSIWFERAYKGTAMWTGPGDPVFEHRWITRKEFLFAKIKGII